MSATGTRNEKSAGALKSHAQVFLRHPKRRDAHGSGRRAASGREVRARNRDPHRSRDGTVEVARTVGRRTIHSPDAERGRSGCRFNDRDSQSRSRLTAESPQPQKARGSNAFARPYTCLVCATRSPSPSGMRPPLTKEDQDLDRQWRETFGEPMPILGGGEIVRQILKEARARQSQPEPEQHPDVTAKSTSEP